MVNPRPTKPNVWTTDGRFDFCAGDSIALQAESIGAAAYRWVLDETVTAVTEGAYILSDLTPGTHSITVTAFSANECTSDTTTVIVTVHTVPASPTLTPAGDLVFCEGTAGSVTLTASAVAGAVSYEWYRNGSLLEGVTSTTYFTSVAGVYVVRALNAIGCASPLSAPVSVVTLSLPTTPVLSLFGVPEFCEGASALLQTHARDAATYTWLLNGEAIEGEGSSLLEVTESGSYTVAVVSSDDCPAPPLRSEAVVITVHPKPGQPTITFSPPGNEICAGESRTLQATPEADATYNWHKDGVQVQEGAPAAFTVTEAGFYQVETVSDKGCVSAISVPAELKVNPVPATPVITGETIACAGEPLVLEAASAGASTYVWYRNGVEIQRDLSPAYTEDTRVAANTLYEYTVQTISADLCESTLSAGKQVTIEVYPVAPVIGGDPTVRATRGSSYTFEVVTPDSNLQYQWLFAPKPTPRHRAGDPAELPGGQGLTLPLPNIQLTDAGVYYVIAITPKAGCLTKSDAAELQVLDDIKVGNIVTPNGDGENDRLFIEGLDSYKSHDLHIVNRYGNEVYSTSNYPAAASEQARSGWAGSNLPDGVYFYSIVLTDDDDTIVKRTGYITLKH